MMNNEKKRNVDPITSQVVIGSLENVAIEMGHKLARMSYSSIIRESEDFGCGLINIEGEQLCESTQSTPLQSGPIPGYIKGIRQIMEERSEQFHPGDVILHNSPYHGASHGPDFGICIPVFYKQELIGFSVTTAHHLDVGALSPGSCGIVDAIDAYAEGLQFKAIKVYDKGTKNQYVWDILRDNIRNSSVVVGDIEAQIAAARIGEKRYVEIVEKYGLHTVKEVNNDLKKYSENLLRNAIKKLPDGKYSAEGFLDGYLDSEDPNKKDLKIAVSLTIKGSDITVDLTGTSAQIDLPINMPFIGTVDIAIYLTLRSILLDSTVYGNIPPSAGLSKPIKIVAPKGTLVNPNFPAPTIARVSPGNIVADTLMRTLGQIVPKQISAGVGNISVISYSGLENEDYWVHMDILEGSYGGRYGMDGMDTVDPLYANTRNNPIEDIESHYPIRVKKYQLRNNAIGAGKWRGGIGFDKEICLLSDGSFSVEGEGQKYPAWGFDGGHEGFVGEVLFESKNGDQKPLPSKIPYFVMKEGDILKMKGPCGGGYGNPLERDPEKVLSDVLDGYISTDTAKKDYGVVITDYYNVDYEETGKLRS